MNCLCLFISREKPTTRSCRRFKVDYKDSGAFFKSKFLWYWFISLSGITFTVLFLESTQILRLSHKCVGDEIFCAYILDRLENHAFQLKNSTIFLKIDFTNQNYHDFDIKLMRLNHKLYINHLKRIKNSSKWEIFFQKNEEVSPLK